MKGFSAIIFYRMEKIFIVEESLRIDKLLAKQFAEYSRTYFQYLIDNGHVLLNGRRIKKKDMPRKGDEVKVMFVSLPSPATEAEDIPLDIIYEDEHIIVINKPTGMVVHPAHGNWSKTLVNGLLFHCDKLQKKENDLRPGIVHRLDKDTSGVLIAAKTEEAKTRLVEAFKNRAVKKKYLAICVGKPKEGEFSAPIGRDVKYRQRMAIVANGKMATSFFKVLQYNEQFSLVEVEISTGRTHQIRVHLQHLKAPILGDAVYGNSRLNKSFNIKRQLLHAYELMLKHPITGKNLAFTAPPPKDFKDFIKNCFKSHTTL
jgi:23S rRNA pseudouridine1911/1915/1917 synthase